jgi:hypothetical protein
MVMNRRAHRRYSLVFPVSVRISIDGQNAMFETECVELSADALTLGCDETVIGALLAQAHFPRTCTLGFAPPDSTRQFDIDCHVVRHRRLSRRQFHLVAMFRHFHDGSAESLVEYLANLEQTLNGGRTSAQQARS